MAAEIRCFEPGDYAGARSLWEQTEGVGLSASDDEDAILSFLSRNPGLSFVAVSGGQIVGTILVGQDGRRGLIHHLAVAGSHRHQGLGRKLVHAGLAALSEANIGKCHLLVFEDNESGRAFWEAIGSTRRNELVTYSISIP